MSVTTIPTAGERAAFAVHVLDERARHTSTSRLEDALWDACNGDPCDYTVALVAAQHIRRDRTAATEVGTRTSSPLTAPVPRHPSPGAGGPSRQAQFVRLHLDGTHTGRGGGGHPPVRLHPVLDTVLIAACAVVGPMFMFLAGRQIFTVIGGVL